MKMLKYLLPVWLKKILKYIVYSTQDFLDFIRGKKSDLPPKRLNFVGSHDFERVGKEFLEHFKNAGLKPGDNVLDIGSGIGRMAIPMIKYLKNGQYFGFDIDKRGIEWCQKNLTPKYPNFHFDFVNIFNKYYNKKGDLQSSEFKFPYKNDFFDFVFATSVFTHMLTKDVEHYMEEIHRVLKPGGIAFLTFFAMDDETKANIKSGKTHCKLIYKYDKNAFYSHKDVMEAEVGFEKEWIVEKLKKYGIGEKVKMWTGSWSGKKNPVSYQDVFLSSKRPR